MFWNRSLKILEQGTNFRETWCESNATDDNPQNAEFPMINNNNMAEARI